MGTDFAVQWHPEASAEFEADIDWYGERDLRAGDRFESEVLSAVDSAAASPTSWAKWPGWDRAPVVRSKGVTGFPYRVVYYVDRHLLTIVAIAHTSRLPEYWRGRVQ